MDKAFVSWKIAMKATAAAMFLMSTLFVLWIKWAELSLCEE